MPDDNDYDAAEHQQQEDGSKELIDAVVRIDSMFRHAYRRGAYNDLPPERVAEFSKAFMLLQIAVFGAPVQIVYGGEKKKRDQPAALEKEQPDVKS